MNKTLKALRATQFEIASQFGPDSWQALAGMARIYLFEVGEALRAVASCK